MLARSDRVLLLCSPVIEMEPDIAQGRAVRYVASAADFKGTSAFLPPQLRNRVHAGELEALTYLRLGNAHGVAFLTADGGAIEATVVLGFSESAMSLQRALQMCGVTKVLPYEHTEALVSEAKRRGGTGMLAPLLDEIRVPRVTATMRSRCLSRRRCLRNASRLAADFRCRLFALAALRYRSGE